MSGSMRGRWLAVSAGIIGVDQLTKYLSLQCLTSTDFIPVFPGLKLVLRYNSGAAFSFLASGSGWQRWFLMGFALVVSLILYGWLGKLSRQEKQTSFALALILGGAIGNVVDRIQYGHVVDFILLYYKTWEWPAFNVADAAICLGVALLAPMVWKKDA